MRCGFLLPVAVVDVFFPTYCLLLSCNKGGFRESEKSAMILLTVWQEALRGLGGGRNQEAVLDVVQCPSGPGQKVCRSRPIFLSSEPV